MTRKFVTIAFALLLATQPAVADQSDENAATSDAAGAADERPRLQEPGERRRQRERPTDRVGRDDRPSGRRRNEVDNDDSADKTPRRTIVLRLRHAPALDVAAVISKWVDSEQYPLTIVPDAIANSLVVTGPESHLEGVRNIISELDQPPQQIRVRTTLVEIKLPGSPTAATLKPGVEIAKGSLDDVLAELSKRGEVKVVSKPELLTSNNQPAFAQFSNRVPRVLGGTFSSRGRSNNVQLEDVGTTLGFTPRVSVEGTVMLEIDVDWSYLGPEGEGAVVSSSPEGHSIRSAEVKTVKIQSTVSLRSGQCVLLGGMMYQDANGSRELLLLVQPEIME